MFADASRWSGFAALALLAAACVSVDRGRIEPSVANLGNGLQRTCFGNGRGDFQGTLRIDGTGTLTVEGAWTSGFEELALHVISPLGEEWARVTFRDGDGEPHWGSPPPRDAAPRAVLEFLASFAPRDIRRLTCGAHVFPSTARDSRNADAPSVPTLRPPLRTTSKMANGRRGLHFQNTFSGIPASGGTGFEHVSITTIVKGGLFGRQNLGRLHWRGAWGRERIAPGELSFEPSSENLVGFNLVFSDFQ